MNFQQLRSMRELTRQGFSLTEVAQVLNSSQPNISKQLHDFERDLGIRVFERKGKRITGLSAPGHDILRIVDRMLALSDQLREAGAEYARDTTGRLTVAATHTQARYSLPAVMTTLSRMFPDVRIALRQGTPEHIAAALIGGTADIGVATEGLTRNPELVAFPCHRWHHLLVVTPDHPLLERDKPSLRDIAAFPLITYDRGLSGRSDIDTAFIAAGLRANMFLTAMDADVIKQYAEMGMGVGLVASIAFDAARDSGLRAIDASHLFAPKTTHLAVRRGCHLRRYAYTFIQQFAPQLTREEIDRRMNEGV